MSIPSLASDTEIINLALIRLGHDTIADIDEDTPAAILARATYDTARRSLLEMQAWNFATRWTTLSAGTLPTAAAAKYDYAFPLPSDCIRVLEVEFQSQNEGEEWEVGEDDLLLTNLASDDLRIRYVFDHTNVAEWSPSFIDTLASKLQAEWAESLVKDTALAKRQTEQYETVLARARTYDSAQMTPRRIETDAWTRVR